MSTSKQRQEIGYMRKLMSLEEEIYREMLFGFNEANSSKDLSEHEAKCLLKSLRDKAKFMGLFKPVKQYSFQKYRHSELDGRVGMASGAQLRKIEAMWYAISRQKTDLEREKSLLVMVKKITGKEHLKFITAIDTRKIIRVFEKMKGKENDTNTNKTNG